MTPLWWSQLLATSEACRLTGTAEAESARCGGLRRPHPRPNFLSAKAYAPIETASLVPNREMPTAVRLNGS